MTKTHNATNAMIVHAGTVFVGEHAVRPLLDAAIGATHFLEARGTTGTAAASSFVRVG